MYTQFFGRNIYNRLYYEKMKNFYALLMVAVIALPMFAAGNTSDSTYVPNQFKNNWEINVMGGVTVPFLGLNHSNFRTPADTYKGLGYGGELTATKWFNPMVAGRFGWQGEKGVDFKGNNLFNNYFHIDFLWDWCSQFGGYKSNRIYSFIPYLHAGVYYNPKYNAMIAGGAGLLNSFRVSEHWKINLDIRGNITTGNKFGVNWPDDNMSGITGMIGVYAGVTYCFGEKTKWNTVTRKAAEQAPVLEQENTLLVAQANAEAARMSDALREAAEANDKLARALAELEQAKKALNDRAGKGSDGAQMMTDIHSVTVHYNLGKTQLTPVEKGHLATYLQMIESSGVKGNIRFTVTGRADTATGYDAYNREIAKMRAESIKQELMKLGVAESQIETNIELVNSGNRQLDRAAMVTFSL